jgi:N-acetylglucosamine-6-phosphate deacetylase
MEMGSILLASGDVVTREGVCRGLDVRVADGVIAEIGRSLSRRGPCIEAGGLLVAPGFFDVHVHGAGGAMCESGSPQELLTISDTLARFGTTSFLATMATLPAETLRQAVEAVAAAAGHEQGARIAGIHLEGPYLNPRRAGAQAVPWMRAPSIEEIDELQRLSGGRIKLITVAPELEGALPFVSAMRERGVRVSAGHSDATADQMRAAVAAGVTHVTHLFNAMRELHHREPGIVGAALTNDALSTELICDGHHLHPTTVDLALRCKPPGKVVLVSDAVGALGMPEGTYEMFGLRCVISHGCVRLADGGQLAGSCLTLDQAVRNVRAWRPEMPLEALLHCASWAPARVIGVDGAIGTLEPGKRADLTLLNEQLEVVRTFCGGREVWRTE